MNALRKFSVATLAVVMFAGTIHAEIPGQGDDAGKTIVYRDTWGVPHIYAPTDEAGLYAMGYAQAEDRPEQLLTNILQSLGEYSRVVGADAVRSDVIMKMFDHYGAAKDSWEETPDELKAHLIAFADGMNDFYAAHPEDVPEWWTHEKIDQYMIIAFGRMFLYAWSIDDALGDLRRGGVEPGVKRTRRGSNQFAISPSRTADGHAILYIDPHLGWFGTSRFWEVRIHAGGLHGSGFTLPGSPYIGLGHNADLAWAMTTGGPDTADIFELTVNAENPMQYLYDGEWRDFKKKTVTLNIKDVGEKQEDILYSHHGPIVAMEDGKAYAAKTAYHDAGGTNVAWYELNYATDYTGAVRAMDTLSLFPQNVMVADTSGNIYFQRTGRTPIRPEGFDYDYPVNGSTSASEWKGIHPAKDHVQILNPSHGYMQNCNIPPDSMMYDSPFKPEDYPRYIFSDLGYGARGGWTNQRGARAVEYLHNHDSVTLEDALALAVNVHPYGVERWLAVLKMANERFGDEFVAHDAYNAGIKDIAAWDRQVTKDSTAALKYAYWRLAAMAAFDKDYDDLSSRIDHYRESVGEPKRQVEVGASELLRLAQAFADGMDTLVDHWGTLDATYGDKFRVGREDMSWPVGGGGLRGLGLTCLRVVGFGGEQDDHTHWGRSGQTSTQIVQLSKPIRSFTQPPIGQSDRPESPHFRDQAEKLFSKRELKESWWLPEDLKGNIESRTVLDGGPGAKAAAAPSHADAVMAVIDTWFKALAAENVDEAITQYSDDFEDSDGRDKASSGEFLKGAIDQGFLSGLELGVEDAEVDIEGEEATVGPLDLSSDAGAFTLDMYLKLEGDTWRIVGVDVY